jgi:hypothetical protein
LVSHWHQERAAAGTARKKIVEKSIIGGFRKRNGIALKLSTHNPAIEGLNPTGSMRELLLVQ